MLTSWLLLAVSICLEVCGTISMKHSDGFSRLVPTLLVFLFYGLSFFGLAVVLKKIDVGVAYAIWAGGGTALIALIGIFFFKEDVSFIKLASVALIITGVVGLNLGGVKH